MAARAIWKGNIVFGSINVPIKLYSAAEDHGIHFKLLDRRTKKPVKQHMVNPETGDVVDYAETQRAFELENGDLVLLDDEDLEGLEPEESRDIEILHVFPAEEITHQWYDRPYWLAPDGNNKGYFAVAAALAKENKQALARWVMRKREYFGALRPEGEHLMLITLRHADEVVSPSELSAPSGRDLTAAEVKMAKQLVAAMEGDFDLSQFGDQYRERVLEFVKAKASGKVVHLPRARTKKPEKDLESVLKRSLAAAERERASA
jgi:DNA end-binding protein Ku